MFNWLMLDSQAAVVIGEGDHTDVDRIAVSASSQLDGDRTGRSDHISCEADEHTQQRCLDHCPV